MSAKTDMIPSSAKGFRLIGKVYRWVGWFGIAATIVVTLYSFVSQWHQISNYPNSYGSDFYRFVSPFLLAILVFACGLLMCAAAFLVSAIIDTCVNITENNRARVDLLRRLVREQSDVQ
jgi:hypothetical protein